MNNQNCIDHLTKRWWKNSEIDQANSTNFMPATDIVENGSDLVIRVDLPGFAKKDINLRISGNILSIKARREAEEKPLA